jgi:threonine dehydratase
MKRVNLSDDPAAGQAAGVVSCGGGDGGGTGRRAAPDLADVRTAAERVAPYIRRTPVLRAEIGGRPLALKLEHLQRTGSFKIRGALSALLSTGGGHRPERVVTASGGNHGLGVAAAARWLGAAATVFVPGNVPEAKARRIAATGAEVVRTGRRYADAEQAARDLAARDGVRYLHAYDDPRVVAGQGTIGLEIAADAPDCDTVVAAVGGGGLLAGVSVGAAPRRAVGVEPEGCPTLHSAMAAGTPVDVGVDSVAASALGATRLGAIPFAVFRERPPALALVSDAEIIAARDRLWEEFRLAVEPAAAAVFAAWLAGRVPGSCPCLVLSGGNTGWSPAS